MGLSRDEFTAMGATIVVLYPQTATQAVALVRGLFAEWEQRLSRFLPDSDLSRLNRHAGRPIVAPPLLFALLKAALTAAEAADGLYDPTMLHQIEALGYDRSFEQIRGIPLDAPTFSRLPAVGGRWREVVLDEDTRMVLTPPGVGVDLGGIAKGMAVDAALALLTSWGVGPALVSAGGDLAVSDLPAGHDGWPISVEGPRGTWTIPLSRGAMATSGVARRHWLQGLHARHHLLDPRSGEPAQSGVWSVTVVAASCAQAEAATKAAFILGPEAGTAFLEEHGLAGLFVDADGAWCAAGPWPRGLMEQKR